tara:strand:- start:396 stop:557 length:162 start_codon:yes stop_codon:yes gene_type:complete
METVFDTMRLIIATICGILYFITAYRGKGKSWNFISDECVAWAFAFLGWITFV